MQIFGKTFYITLSAIFSVELMSLLVHFYPSAGSYAFAMLAVLFLVFCIVKIEYGLLILLTELFIGSFGRLFVFELADKDISIRMVFWLIFLTVWAGRQIWFFIKKDERFLRIKEFKGNKIFHLYALLFVFIIWGLVNAFLNNTSFVNVFFDFNAWAFFILLLPIYEIFKHSEKFIDNLFQVFMAAIIWLSIKTYVLLFIFSHNIFSLMPDIYAWIRDTRIGELTQMQTGFTRIFFQSHIFVLVGVFVAAVFLLKYFQKFFKNNNKIILKEFFTKEFFVYFLLLSFFISVNLISFSRSNWMGLAAAFFLFFIIVFRLLKIKKTLYFFGIFLLSGILALFLITVTVKFPYPNSENNFNAAKLITERAKTVSGEAGVSSRWSLLPELWQEIKKAPIRGQGFGAEVTYKSSDPRVLEKNPDGFYTTYAFEWGWLDIWLKIGFFGFLIYAVLIFIIVYKIICPIIKEGKFNLDAKNGFKLSLAVGLAAIAIINFFSPYLNHPLGIGYLLLLTSLHLSFQP
ncbi:O-antigen ligase family protein [Candidatus Parcubacteria bacterium]|nr:O-antigen ligase family protein [Candidatus Parcubacteria bacterium]